MAEPRDWYVPRRGMVAEDQAVVAGVLAVDVRGWRVLMAR